MSKQPKFTLPNRRNSSLRKHDHDSREDILRERVGDNPVEILPRSILRKSNSTFSNNCADDCSITSLSINDDLRRRRYQKVNLKLPQTSSSAKEKVSIRQLSPLKISGSKFPFKEDGEDDEEQKDYNNNNTGYQPLEDNQHISKRHIESGTPNSERGSSPVSTTAIPKKVSLPDTPKKTLRPQRNKLLLLPEHIYAKIFDHLNQIELHVCTQVCKQWREYCDTFYNEPRVFNGWKSERGSSISKNKCRIFLNDELLSQENKRHYKLYFYNTTDSQMKTIICERPEEFHSGVRHMTKLHLVNCNLHWQSLITLLQSLTHLNTFTDTWSVHYQHSSCCTSICRPNTNQGTLQKLPEKLMLSELKNKVTRIRVFKLTRRSFRKELCAYFQVISRMTPYLEDFQFYVGPWKTPREKLASVREWLPEFFKSFNSFMARLRRNFKKVTISWLDDGLDCLFDNCVEALHIIDFPRLVDIKLNMNEGSMISPQNLPQFVRFLNAFEWKPGKNKFMHIKVYVCPIFMTKDWKELLYTLQSRIILRKLHVSLRFGVKLDDKLDIPERSATVTNIFGNYVFFRGLTRLQVNIHQEVTQSIREVIPGIRTIYPNVESLEIRIGERKPGKCFAFRDYSIISIAFNFKFITELRISDQPERKWDVLDCIWGTRDRASLTYAYISKRDMVLLCEMLTRLKVLMLWANLNDLRDINFTGIKSRYYYMRSDGQYYVNKEQVFKERMEPSIQNLKRTQVIP